MPGIRKEIVEITQKMRCLKYLDRAAPTRELTVGRQASLWLYFAARPDERAGRNVAVVMQAAPSANTAATMKEAT